ncbi:MAG: T9SS type A sorting domain-containing protein [Candidatus Kapabacteria bacterium]|nr:T9SS type A sorting domain-containing protein [Candidatus Kapabacteria bacterium]
MRHWLIIAAITALGIVRTQAQVEIFIDESAKSDTVIVFGVTTFNRPLTRSFTVRNATDSTVRIVPSRTDISGQQSPVVNEFEGLFSNEDISPQTTRSLNVRYRADVAFFPADSVAEVRLVLDVLRLPSQSPIQRKVLILRGLKTGNVLGTVQRHVRFDSVYLATPMARQVTYTVQNLLPVRFPVVSQRLLLRTPSLGPQEIQVDTFARVEFPERGAIDWKVSYRPLDRGRDSADFELRYVNADNVRDTIVMTRISGVGVEQRIDIVGASASGVSSPIVVAQPDTVIVSDVLAGSVVNLNVRLRNAGNADVHIDSIVVVPIKGQGAFTLSRFATSIGIDRTDTVSVGFAPSQRGECIARLDVFTDLLRRGFGDVPSEAARRSLIVIGRARSSVKVVPEPLSLGPVIVSSTCSNEASAQVEISNLGNTDIRVDSVTVSPPDAGITVTPQQYLLPAGAVRTLQCSFRAGFPGRITGDVVLHSTGVEPRRPIPFVATAISADTLALHTVADASARPGSVVAVPVVVGSGFVRGLQRASLFVNFNPSVAAIIDLQRQGTASATALASIDARPQGAVVDLRDDAGFGEGDTLITLRMRLFLGDSSSTRVVINPDNSTVGLAECPDLLPLRVRAGRVSIDSVCGLSYKTAVSGLKTFRAGVLPNPAFDGATVAVIAQQGSVMSVDVLDALGRPCVQTMQVVCTDAITTATIDVSMLPPAAYAVVVRMGDGMQTIPLVVQR